MNIRTVQTTFVIAVAVAIAQWASLASAQPATTVQLPTFSFFTVNTTVSVPDRGGTYLGGMLRGYDSSIARGWGPAPLLSNKGLASERSAAGTSVHAYIHRFAEMDEELLAEAARRHRPADTASAKGSLLSESIGRGASTGAAGGGPVSEPILSVAEIRRRNEQADQAELAEALALFAEAQKQEAEGKLGLARLNYQRVLSRECGELKQQAAARIRALNASGKKQKK